MRSKIANEIKFIMGQSVYPLTGFLNFILDEHKIDTIVYMMDGIKNGRGTDELLKNCDPMGMFTDAEIKAMVTQDDDFVALYQNVLCDLPVGKYFIKFLDEEIKSVREGGSEEIDATTIAQIIRGYTMD